MVDQDIGHGMVKWGTGQNRIVFKQKKYIYIMKEREREREREREEREKKPRHSVTT